MEYPQNTAPNAVLNPTFGVGIGLGCAGSGVSPPPPPPPPTSYLLDHYVDTNGTNITSHVMDVGPGYSPTIIYGTWQIESNSAQLNVGGAGSNYNFCAANASHSDGTATVTAVHPSSGNFSDGVAFRIQDNQNFWVCRATNLNNTFVIQEVNAGVVTTQASTSFSPVNSGTDVYKAVLSGTSITCQVNGANTLTFTSSDFQTQTYFGPSQYFGSGFSVITSFGPFQVTP